MRLKFMNKILVVVLLIMAGSLSLVGCGKSKNDAPVGAAFVMGIHSNAPALSFDGNTTKQIEDLLYQVSESYGSVYYIRCDGNPKIYFSANVEEPDVKNLSSSKLKTIAKSNADSLAGALLSKDALAEVAEVDTLGALKVAADSLLALDDSMEKRLIIADSGISTCSYLNFTEHAILSINVEDLMEKLEEAKAIPNLKDVKVDWYYLGATAGNQKTLSDKQVAALEDIWSAVLEASGAKATFHTDVINAEEYADLPLVSAVEAEEKALSIEEYVEELVEEPDIIAVLMDEYVQFNGDKATFVDETVAKNSISEVAELLNRPENQNMEVLVVGTTANIYGKEDSYFKKLSTDRAGAVMRVLVECGVDESRLTSIGLGHDDPWYQYDLNSNNRQIEEIAQLNRKCVIVNKNSDVAKECLDIFNAMK